MRDQQVIKGNIIPLSVLKQQQQSKLANKLDEWFKNLSAINCFHCKSKNKKNLDRDLNVSKRFVLEESRGSVSSVIGLDINNTIKSSKSISISLNDQQNNPKKGITFALLFGDETCFNNDSIDNRSNDTLSRIDWKLPVEISESSCSYDESFIRIETNEFIVTRL